MVALTPPDPSEARRPADDRLVQPYLELLKRHLLRGSFRVPSRIEGDRRWFLYSAVSGVARRLGFELVRRVGEEARRQGLGSSSDADTLIGSMRLENLQVCVTDVLDKGIPGDFIETGVWRGGASIFMRGILQAYGVTDRVVWLADSFQGLPKPDAVRYPADAGDRFWRVTAAAVSLEEVKANIRAYGLLDSQVKFLVGWFRDTLRDAPISQLAILRLDGDMYESTVDALTALYPRLSKGGYVIVDDYGAVPACRQAVHDYRAAMGIAEEIHRIDWTGVYWRRET